MLLRWAWKVEYGIAWIELQVMQFYKVENSFFFFSNVANDKEKKNCPGQLGGRGGEFWAEAEYLLTGSGSDTIPQVLRKPEAYLSRSSCNESQLER